MEPEIASSADLGGKSKSDAGLKDGSAVRQEETHKGKGLCKEMLSRVETKCLRRFRGCGAWKGGHRIADSDNGAACGMTFFTDRTYQRLQHGRLWAVQYCWVLVIEKKRPLGGPL